MNFTALDRVGSLSADVLISSLVTGYRGVDNVFMNGVDDIKVDSDDNLFG